MMLLKLVSWIGMGGANYVRHSSLSVCRALQRAALLLHFLAFEEGQKIAAANLDLSLLI
jgi:hypothetical protein